MPHVFERLYHLTACHIDLSELLQLLTAHSCPKITPGGIVSRYDITAPDPAQTMPSALGNEWQEWSLSNVDFWR